MELLASSKTNGAFFSSLKKSNIPPSRLLKVAYVSKAHGIKGEVFICPLNSRPDWPHPLREVIIGGAVFSVQKYSPHKNGLIFQLEGCQTRPAAEALKAQAVFLPKKLFKSAKGERLYLAELLSFRVEVSGQGPIGSVQSFQSSGAGDFMLVKQRGKETAILIPFVAAYIKDICFLKKALTLNLPENFLEIFA